jgi:hypothetical protein
MTPSMKRMFFTYFLLTVGGLTYFIYIGLSHH